MNDFYAHETAVVDGPADIGQDTKIWHFSHIMAGAKIGTNCNIGQNVFIGKDATLGNNCKVQNNVSVYDGVQLEDDVFLGPSMVFTNVSTPRSHVNRKGQYQKTLVQKGVTIGANATVVCGHTIGAFAFIGAGAVVTKDVSPHALMVGNPARRTGWMCHCGAKLDQNLSCDECKNKYQIRQNTLCLRRDRDQ